MHRNLGLNDVPTPSAEGAWSGLFAGRVPLRRVDCPSPGHSRVDEHLDIDPVGFIGVTVAR